MATRIWNFEFRAKMAPNLVASQSTAEAITMPTEGHTMATESHTEAILKRLKTNWSRIHCQMLEGQIARNNRLK